jgi:hypothetical protein
VFQRRIYVYFFCLLQVYMLYVSSFSVFLT